MPYTCPQCGARYTADETCQDRFNTVQLTELDHPAYYVVHHFSVPCYMLQHNAYSREGWLQVWELLDKFVYRGLTPAMARRQNRIAVDSGHRKFSFTKGPKLPGVENITWKMTIADVRLDTAEHYTADVLSWAKSILADSAYLVREPHHKNQTDGGRRRKRQD